MLVFKNAQVITGDGKTQHERATVLVEAGRIEDVVQGDLGEGVEKNAERVVDCKGKLVIPGAINHHAHGCHRGPLWPSASPTLPEDKVLYHLDRHLLGGTTTILNLCGFASVDDVSAGTAFHPLQVKAATSYTPSSIQAANTIDGTGFKEWHRHLTVEKELEAGAVAIGEVGSGMTLAGGGQEYHFIPRAIKQATGKTLEPHQARQLKEGALGRFADPADYKPEAMQKALKEVGLEDDLDVERAKQIIVDTVMPCLGPALDGFDEAVADAKKFGVKAVFHNAPQAMRRLLKVAEQGRDHVVAGHSNHSNFEFEEALQVARDLRERGALVDISTLDAWGAKRLSVDPELFYEFYRRGLVDLVSTDFAGGYFDPVLVGVEQAFKAGAALLPAIIATATYNVAYAFPRLAPERGLIARGKIADLVVTDPKNVSKVEQVFIGGRAVVENGARVYEGKKL